MHVPPRVTRHVSAGEVAKYVADNLVILQTIDEQKCDTKYNMQKYLFFQARGHLFQIPFDMPELVLSAWQFRHHWVHDFDFSCFGADELGTGLTIDRREPRCKMGEASLI